MGSKLTTNVYDYVTITALEVLTQVDSEYHPMQSRGGFPVGWPKQLHTLQNWARNVYWSVLYPSHDAEGVEIKLQTHQLSVTCDFYWVVLLIFKYGDRQLVHL